MILASGAAAQPDPETASISRSPGWGSSHSSIILTVVGWLIVWPKPIGSGASIATWSLASSGTKLTRSTSRKAFSIESMLLVFTTLLRRAYPGQFFIYQLVVINRKLIARRQVTIRQ